MGATRLRPRGPWRVGSLALLGAMGAVLPVAGSAQDSLAAIGTGGWIGIQTDTARLVTPGSDEATLVIRVKEIQPNGPAGLSGVRPGDILVALNGRELETFDTWLNTVAQLHPGQQLHLRLNRGGVEHEVSFFADLPPISYQFMLEVSGFDTIQASLWQDLDSLFETMFQERRRNLEVTADLAVGVLARADSTSLSFTLTDSSMTLDFQSTEWSVVGPERPTDTGAVVGAAGDLSGDAVDTLGAGITVDPPPTERSQMDSVLLGVLDLAGESLAARPIQGAADLTRDAGASTARLPAADDSVAFSLADYVPMSSLLLGGAQVRTLSRELGRYFGASWGVLILDVFARSPAQRAGFRPGDVIVAIGGSELATLPQLRAQLIAAELPVDITVVRRGELVELTYPVR